MKNWMLAGAVAAVVCLFAAQASAQETIKPPVSSGPVVTGTQVQVAPVARTGLFGRRVERRRGSAMTTTVVPTTVAPPLTTKVDPMPPVTAAPMTTQVVETRSGGLGSRLRMRLGR